MSPFMDGRFQGSEKQLNDLGNLVSVCHYNHTLRSFGESFRDSLCPR